MTKWEVSNFRYENNLCPAQILELRDRFQVQAAVWRVTVQDVFLRVQKRPGSLHCLHLNRYDDFGNLDMPRYRHQRNG